MHTLCIVDLCLILRPENALIEYLCTGFHARASIRIFPLWISPDDWMRTLINDAVTSNKWDQLFMKPLLFRLAVRCSSQALQQFRFPIESIRVGSTKDCVCRDLLLHTTALLLLVHVLNCDLCAVVPMYGIYCCDAPVQSLHA